VRVVSQPLCADAGNTIAGVAWAVAGKASQAQEAEESQVTRHWRSNLALCEPLHRSAPVTAEQRLAGRVAQPTRPQPRPARSRAAS